MTEVLQSPPSHHFPYPSSSSSTPCAPNNYNNSSSSSNNGGLGSSLCIADIVKEREQEDQERELDIEQEEGEEERERGEGDRLSLLTLLVAAFRKSLVGCSIGKELCSMEIGLPTNVRHVAHVTFDRFNGFLGLPVEFEPEVPRRAPSASATVFGVSTKSMQLSFDSRGNSVPTILLLMQRHLYAQEGLRAEGIFRINAENAQEEYVRDQLNRGVVPEDIDVHCLAGLIKAWFRELPTGVLDSLSSEQVMQSQSEEECTRLVRLLPPSEAALLDWAINLMADVAQFEHFNKMNARNVAMVFAPNMTHMSDPLTALMYAVQVMNFLKTLIIKTLKRREDLMVESISFSRQEPSDESGHPSSSDLYPVETDDQANEGNEEEKAFVTGYPVLESPSHPNYTNESIPVSHLDPSDGHEHKSSLDLYPVEIDDQANEGNEEEKAFTTADPALESAPHSPHHNSTTETSSHNFLTSTKNIIPAGTRSLSNSFRCDVISHVNSLTNGLQEGGFTGSSRRVQTNISKIKTGLKGPKKLNEQSMALAAGPVEKSNGDGIVGLVNSRPELFEALRRRSTI